MEALGRRNFDVRAASLFLNLHLKRTRYGNTSQIIYNQGRNPMNFDELSYFTINIHASFSLRIVTGPMRWDTLLIVNGAESFVGELEEKI